MQKTVTEHIRESLLTSFGTGTPKVMPDLETLRRTEWSSEFEELMRNRLIMGAFRYGAFNKQNRSTDAMVSSIEKYINMYRETGNTECLVDVANLAMKEFVCGDHPLKHFKATDDKDHVEEKT